MEDSEVVRLFIKTQRPDYFSMLYQRYSGKVYSKCIFMLKNDALAKDATQEIFTKIFLNLSKFSGRSKFSTWLYSITYNFCIDTIRKRKKEKNLFTDEKEDAPDIIEEVSDEAMMEMEVKRLKKVLEEIPSGDRAVLLMKYQDEMSIKEIAEILDKTESAVKMKIKRAKHKAQQVYKDIFPNK